VAWSVQHCVQCVESCVASCGRAEGSNTGGGAGARGAAATREAGLRRMVPPVQAGVVGARRAVQGGQRLSWAAEARTAGGTWGITAHQHATERLVLSWCI
jgi:hypothetical protein